MPEYDDLPTPQDASADEPVTDVSEERDPTPQGRADVSDEEADDVHEVGNG